LLTVFLPGEPRRPRGRIRALGDAQDWNGGMPLGYAISARDTDPDEGGRLVYLEADVQLEDNSSGRCSPTCRSGLNDAEAGA
jgi:hypothetical protein